VSEPPGSADRRWLDPPGRRTLRVEAWQLGRAFVGECRSCLEIPLMGGAFEALADVQVLVLGCSGPVTIDGSPMKIGSRIRMRRGSVLEIGPSPSGVRAYLFARGGFLGKPVLGSLSGTHVQAGDVLECSSETPLSDAALDLATLLNQPFRVIQAEGQEAAFEALLQGSFRASPQSSRMGIRLTGPEMPQLPERPSEPAVLGAIQLPPGGEPIILGPDGPTIGGYPKIAYVASADLDRLAQLRPGDPVLFQSVTYNEARELARQRERSFQTRLAMMKLT
jgi:5-oxoprolinase (ATP-hydrolysing) subunit C